MPSLTMIRTLFFQPLGPALVLVLSALSIWLISWLAWRSARARRSLASLRFRIPLVLLSIVAAAWLWLRIAGAPTSHDLAWRWQPLTVAGATIHWRVEPWNWFVVLLILIFTAAAILLGGDDAPRLPAAGAEERTLLLGAAAAIFVCSANVITMASSWLVLDAALTWRVYVGRQAEPAGRMWGLLTMAGPLLLFALAMLGESSVSSALVGGRFGRQEITLLWILALLRVGVYPLHFWLTSPGKIGAGAQIAVHIIGPAAGIWLLARVLPLAGSSLTQRPEWAALGALALLGTAMAAWVAEQGEWRWRWLAINRSGVVLLAAFVAGASGPQALAWTLATFGLGSLLVASRFIAPQARRWRLPALIGALTLWGMPGTVGFLARSALIFPTELPLAAPLFFVVLAGEVLLVAALWEAVWGDAGSAEPSSDLSSDRSGHSLHKSARLILASIVLVVPAIAWGLFPGLLAGLSGSAPPESLLTLEQSLTTARRSVWIGLAVSGLGGAMLGISRTAIFGQMRGWQQAIGAAVGLEWLYQAAVGGLRLAGSGLQYFARLGEGEGYLGWLALAGLLLWLLLRG